MSTVHTSDLDHAILAAVHSDAPHADAAAVRAVELAEDGTPTRYRAVVTINRSGEGGTAVEALAAARTRLRAAMVADAIERVRKLHTPTDGVVCTQCCVVRPCPTLAAVDGLGVSGA